MSGPIDQLAKVANGDMELLANLIEQLQHDVQTDARVRYEYDKETYADNIDIAQMNAKGYSGWEVVQVFTEKRSSGIAYGGVYGTDTFYQVLYKRPWFITQPQDTNE